MDELESTCVGAVYSVTYSNTLVHLISRVTRSSQVQAIDVDFRDHAFPSRRPLISNYNEHARSLVNVLHLRVT